MPQLMLVNPRKRRTSRKGRSAAQKAATRKLVAFNKSRRSGHRTVARRKSRSVARRRNPVGLARVTHHRVARRSRSRRRNPIALRGIGSSVTSFAMPSLQGAVGAIAVNTALNYIPLPEMLKSGNGKYLARAGLALAVGVFGKKLVGQKVATNAAVGALTVALHDLLLGLASQQFPTLLLGDVGDYDTGVSEYVSGMGEYVSGVGNVYDQSM